MQKRQMLWAAGFILTAVFLVPLLMVISQQISKGSGEAQYGINGEKLMPLSFEWQDVTANLQTFPANRPQFTYLFAGFLSCSEICPIRIQQLHQLESTILKGGDFNNIDIAFMFITIDPENDTLAIRQQVIDERSPRFKSAMLEESELLSLSRHLSENIQSYSPSNNHVGNLYLINPNGFVARIYTARQLSTDKMLAELKHYIETSKGNNND